MARWENEDISGLNLPDSVVVRVTFLDFNGDESEQASAVAKTVASSNGSTQYFIKYGRNELLDPHQTDSSYANSRRQTHMYKFKKVSENTFEAYVQYLQSKNRLHFTRARRFLMEN